MLNLQAKFVKFKKISGTGHKSESERETHTKNEEHLRTKGDSAAAWAKIENFFLCVPLTVFMCADVYYIYMYILNIYMCVRVCEEAV